MRTDMMGELNEATKHQLVEMATMGDIGYTYTNPCYWVMLHTEVSAAPYTVDTSR